MKRMQNNVRKNICVSVLCGGLIIILLTACTSIGPRIQTSHVPAGSLQLAEVMFAPSQQQINEAKWLHDDIIGAGIKEAEIRDGSVVFARVYCCGGPNERDTAPIVYVPAGIKAEPGDIIEIKVGHPSREGDPGQLNIVTQIRQKTGEKGGSIRWDPPNELLWGRVLYADWMPKEGWIRQGGLYHFWFKPAPTGKP